MNDDETLAAALEAARKGDEASFRLLYRALQPGILRYLRTLVGEEAEDIASETWVQVVRGLDTFTGSADDFRGWTTTIARNRAIDHLRRVRRRPVADAPVEELFIAQPAAENTAETVMAALGTDEALAMLASLPRDQGEALVLRIVLDLDVESTARILGKRPGAVRSAAHRGLRRLARLLEAGTLPQRQDPAGSAVGAASSRTGRTGRARLGTRASRASRVPRSLTTQGTRAPKSSGGSPGALPPPGAGGPSGVTPPTSSAQSVTEQSAAALKDVR